jgi:hypothetical protein
MSDTLLDIRKLMQQPAMSNATTGSLTIADIDALIEMMHESEKDAPSYQFTITVHRYQQLRHIHNLLQRRVRHKKITRRQHRATARRRSKGLA